jgi:hypothetical protein
MEFNLLSDGNNGYVAAVLCILLFGFVVAVCAAVRQASRAERNWSQLVKTDIYLNACLREIAELKEDLKEARADKKEDNYGLNELIGKIEQIREIVSRGS